MTSGHPSAVQRQFHRLLNIGSVAGLTEAQLLERFVARRDEVAFEALVARHGPMVLGVCRQLLRDEHDAEDAFQAAFLVLVRRAGSLRQRELLGNWLYGVAYRVAVRVRCESARRRAHERQDAGGAREPAIAFAGNDLKPDLLEEVHRLPEKYRAPVVLCYFEGLTHDEAAQRLHWPVGTVRSRLARARERLRGRLTRRGLDPNAGLLITATSSGTTKAVPPVLLEGTVKAATQVAAGKATAAGAVSATVAALTEGVLRTMFLTKLKFAAAALTAFGAIASGAGVFAYQQAPGDGPREAVASDLPKPKTTSGAAQKPEDGGTAVQQYLEKTRKEVDAEVAKLTEEVAALQARLQTAQDNLNRLRALQMALDEHNPLHTSSSTFYRPVGVTTTYRHNEVTTASPYPNPTTNARGGYTSDSLSYPRAASHPQTTVGQPTPSVPQTGLPKPASAAEPESANPFRSTTESPAPKASSPDAQRLESMDKEIDRLVKERERLKDASETRPR